MARTATRRAGDDLVRLMHRDVGVREFALGAGRVIGRDMPFDGLCMLTMDPSTLIPTGEVVEDGLPPAATARMAEIEVAGEDVNSFRGLALSGRLAATLSEATDGDLNRSRRHREAREPNGFGDELRVVAADDSGVWGALTLLRGSDRGHFEAADAALARSLAGHLAEGLRRSTVFSALSSPADGGADAAGFVLLAADDSVTMANPVAEEWLAELGEEGAAGELPAVITAVARQARDVVDGPAPSKVAARARVRAPSGRWLLVRGSALDGDTEAHTAVIIEPAGARDMAPLIADAYALTERERAVTRLVAQGLATNAIADRLYISPWTVQDHLKSIFEKVGVGTRGELTARMFFSTP